MTCVTGPGQPQPFALLMLAPEVDKSEANRQLLVQKFDLLLQSLNASLEDHERLDYMVIINDPWTIENGCLTPTMKLRRDVIEQAYLPKADLWRAMNTSVIWE